MRDLYTTVIRHLKSQRDSAADLKLWDDLWAAYERNGAEGIAKTIRQILELPDTGDEKQP